MKVVFLSAPYSSASVQERESITRAVEATAMLLWENNIAVVCPHLNSGHFSDHRPVDPKAYRNGYVEIAARCDAGLTLFPRQQAQGMTAEAEALRDGNKPIFKDVKAVLKWAKS